MGSMTNVVGEAVAAVSVTQALLYIFLALAVYVVYNHIGPPQWKKLKVFQDMGIPYVPLVRGRFEGYKLFFGKKTLWDAETEQVEKYGKLFGKIDTVSGPTIVITDPDLLRDVFVKNFGHFYNRRPPPPGTFKLFSSSLFSQRDQRWHDIRSLVSPTFSSAKMRFMDGLIRDCLKITGLELDGRFEASQDPTVEIDGKDYFSNFAMDVIGTVFFGINLDAIRNRDNPFVKHATIVFSAVKPIGILIFLLAPGSLKKLLIKYGLTGGIGFPLSARNYFGDIIPQMIRDRREAIAKNIQRRDFLNVLITASERAKTNQELTATGTLSDNTADDVHINAGAAERQRPEAVNGHIGASNSAQRTQTGPQVTDLSRKFYKSNAPDPLSDEEIAAQCFIFLIAGFETTATTIGFLFHELAMNQKDQDRLREEVGRVLTSNSANQEHLSYDTLAEMRFLDACITETLRLYPPVTRLERQCAEDCVLSNGLQVKKSLIVAIPTWYIQRSADNFADPLKFDPDRFYDPERRAQIKPFTYLPFGQGPRNCVAMRFALLELKMIAAYVVQNYRIVPTEKTVHPVSLEKRSFGLLRPEKGKVVVGLQKLKANN